MASGEQQGRRLVGGRGIAFDDFGWRVGGSRHIALNVNGRIVRRRLGAAVEDEGRHEEDEQTAGGGVKGAPTLVESAEMVAEAVGEEKRKERGRAEEAKSHQELLDEDWSVHFEFTIFDLRLTSREVFVLPENEGCAFGVEVGGDREVGIREVVRRHLRKVTPR